MSQDRPPTEDARGGQPQGVPGPQGPLGSDAQQRADAPDRGDAQERTGAQDRADEEGRAYAPRADAEARESRETRERREAPAQVTPETGTAAEPQPQSQVAAGPSAAGSQGDAAPGPGGSGRTRRPGVSVVGRLRDRARAAAGVARARLDAPPPSQWAAAQAPTTVHVTVPEKVDEASSPIPRGVQVAAAWSWRLLLVAAAVYLVAHVLAAVPVVTVPFVIALLLTAVLSPVQRRLHRHAHVPHSLAAFLALLLGIAVIGVIVTFVVMQISDGWPRLAQQFSNGVDEGARWLRDGPLHLSDDQVSSYARQASETVSKNQSTLVSGAIDTMSTLSEVVAGSLLLLLSTFFLLRDGESIWGWALSLVPAGSRRRVDQVARVGWHTLGGYMRGVTIIATLHATTVYIVLKVLDVPLAMALAVVIFVGSFVPIIGMTVAGTFCVAVSLVEHGPGAALVVAVVIIILVQLEAHLLQPLIMSRNVEVHPLAVAISVLAGTAVAGVAGALFAVPLVAFANATMRAARLRLPPAPEESGGPGGEGPASAAAGGTRA